MINVDSLMHLYYIIPELGFWNVTLADNMLYQSLHKRCSICSMIMDYKPLLLQCSSSSRGRRRGGGAARAAVEPIPDAVGEGVARLLRTDRAHRESLIGGRPGFARALRGNAADWWLMHACWRRRRSSTEVMQKTGAMQEHRRGRINGGCITPERPRETRAAAN